MTHFDPLALARAQLARDQAATAPFPQLLARKVARMSASPLAFLRGAAPLFYEVVRAQPELGANLRDTPPGQGWIVGDLHVENFGAFRPEPEQDDGHSKADKSARGSKNDKRAVETVEFNLNDFDDAVVGPFHLDVLRLSTSLLLAGREFGADGPTALGLCAALVESYAATLFGNALPPAPPPTVNTLIERVAARSKKELLEGRTEVVHGKRRFVRGERYADLARETFDAVPAAFEVFARKLAESRHSEKKHVDIVDAAFRVAGTGSLGSLRIAVLVAAKDEDGNEWIFDMKEEGTPSAVPTLSAPAMPAAERVETALRACVARPPRALGTTTLGTKSMFVRRLSPQEDKLDLTHLGAPDLAPLAKYLGALTATAHRRGARVMPSLPWGHEEREKLIDRAIVMAGIHEAAYLAFCRLTR